jgi:hypothetical protein
MKQHGRTAISRLYKAADTQAMTDQRTGEGRWDVKFTISQLFHRTRDAQMHETTCWTGAMWQVCGVITSAAMLLHGDWSGSMQHACMVPCTKPCVHT